MTYRILNTTLLLTCIGASLTAIPVHAQTRPAAHSSNFNKRATLCACHLFARDALQREGLTVVEDSESVLIAENNVAIAEVACKPGESQVFVSAFSSDSGTAERIRNNVRTHIVNGALFDTCP